MVANVTRQPYVDAPRRKSAGLDGYCRTRLGSFAQSTDAFIELEREGIKECKTLIKESSGYYHGVFKILLDSMIRDSEKHIELLDFLKEQLK
jgi:hypothetical protein